MEEHNHQPVKVKLTEIDDYWQNSAPPKHISFLKAVVVLLVIGIFIYLIMQQFFLSKTFTYHYDIGSEGETYLAPNDRISESKDNKYRELTNNLVYFNVKVPRGATTITVKTKLHPQNYERILLGARNDNEWSYLWKTIYNPSLDKINQFPMQNGIYVINTNREPLTLNELTKTSDIVIATNDPFNQTPQVIKDMTNKKTTIQNTLRGEHTFYVYLTDEVTVDITKQDLNWYNGSDELAVSLYTPNNTLITNITIPDDGITNVHKNKATPQTQTLRAPNLPEGVYILQITNTDALINNITINTNKIVTKRLFLADNHIYNQEQKPTTLYTKTSSNKAIKLQTYHDAGYQTITINNNQRTFANQTATIILSEQDNYLTFEKNDIIIESPTYLAFEESSWFMPFSQTIIPIPSDISELQQNADYLITDYTPPIYEGDWITTNTTFNVQEDNVYTKDNTLSFVFNIPDINEENQNKVKVDNIEITVFKPGIFTK